METEKETEVWYAMRATYRREPDAMRLLEKEKLDCFVPMQYKISMKKSLLVTFPSFFFQDSLPRLLLKYKVPE